MKRFQYQLIFSVLIGLGSLQGDVVKDPKIYIADELESMKTKTIGRSVGIDGHIARLRALKTHLPAEEVAFKEQIDKGVSALSQMRDVSDDSKISDLSALGVRFADYYSVNKEALDAAPDSDLTKAYYAFLGRGAADSGGPPQRFFHFLLDAYFYAYLHYYDFGQFNVRTPRHVRAAMVDSLSWATAAGDDTGEGSFNLNLIYYFSELWTEVSPRLDLLRAAQRELVLSELELVLGDNGQFDDAIEDKARKNLVAARVRFPKP